MDRTDSRSLREDQEVSQKLTFISLYRIEELENKIGAGLIEEVVQVAENELKLVEVMKENKV